MQPNYLKAFVIFFTSLILFSGCTAPVIKTNPEIVTDTSDVVITCNANAGNKGLQNYTGLVYIHLGLITDRSAHPKDWRHVKFKWGSTEHAARATPVGENSWSYRIPNIRKFFEVDPEENISKLVVLFREGNCVDTLCKVLRNADESDVVIPIKQTNQ
jgi:hypothetical protein